MLRIRTTTALSAALLKAEMAKGSAETADASRAKSAESVSTAKPVAKRSKRRVDASSESSADRAANI